MRICMGRWPAALVLTMATLASAAASGPAARAERSAGGAMAVPQPAVAHDGSVVGTAPARGIGDSHGLVRTQDIVGDFTTLPEQSTPGGPAFGHAVAIAGDWLVVGAPGTRSSSPTFGTVAHGAVFVFRRVDGQWLAWQRILAAYDSDGGGARCGHAVALRLPHLAVGCPAQGSSVIPDRGLVRLYRLDDASQQFEAANLLTSTGDTGRCGASLAMTADFLAIGCPIHGADASGRVRLFRRDSVANTFSIDEGDRLPPSPNADMGFGTAVALYQPGQFDPPPNFVRLAVGAPNTVYDGSPWPRGTAFVFHRATASANWTLFTLRRPAPVGTDGAALAGFGRALALNRTQLVVGAPNNRHGAIQTLPGPGTAHRFEQSADGTWTTMEVGGGVNLPQGPHAGMQFGAAIALGWSGMSVIGAPGTDGERDGGAVADEVGLLEVRRAGGSDWSVSAYDGQLQPAPLSLFQRGEGRFGQALATDLGNRRLAVGYPYSGTTLLDTPRGSVRLFEPDQLFADGFD